MTLKTILERTLWLAVLAVSPTNALPQQAPAAACFNVQSFHAVADGKTKCTEAIRQAIAAASAKGGGTVFFPAGVYLTGPIHLQSHITLYLDAGATLRFSDDFDDYLPPVRSRWEGIEVENFSPLIYANGVEDIAICGRGRLDGQGAKWWAAIEKISTDWKQGTKSTNKWQKSFLQQNAAIVSAAKYELLDSGFLRPPFIQVLACTNVLVEGVTIANSPFWTVNPVYCEDVTVHAVIINNPGSSPNTDGINPDSCRNVHISDCQINSGDDCITIKSGRDADGWRVARPAENYTIVNCTLAQGHGLSIGSEMSGGVRNITIANCTFDGTDRGIRIKSMRGRGGFVENVRISNITMRNIAREGIAVTLNYKPSEPEPVSERTPLFQNIDISGITGDAKIAGQVLGLAERPIKGVRLTDCRLKAETGFKVVDAAGIEFHNVTVDTDKGPALLADKVQDLELDRFTTTKPHPKVPVIDLRNAVRVFVHGCLAAPGTDVFLSPDESSAAQLTLEANSLSQAAVPVAKANHAN
jgi:polygalacturonase